MARTEKGQIVHPGMGGFLNPPTHPEHEWHVQTDLRRRPHNRGGMSLSAATEATWLDAATRSAAKKMLKDWKPPAPNNPEIVDWRQQVLGYFRNMYRNPNAPKNEQWNASVMIVDRDRDPIANADDHAGVHFIRKFYPDYVPTEADFGGAYWGSRPESATVHESRSRGATHRAPVDEHAATELVLFIENTSDLSPDGPRGQGRDVLLNALRKWRKGTYDPERAVTLFGYLVESGAKRYAKEFGSSEREWSTMFNPATRHEAAKQLEASFRNSAQQGEYDQVDTRTGAASRGIQRPTLHAREHRGVRDHGAKSLYDKLKDAGQTLDHHESDLYVKWTPEAEAIIKAHGGTEAANARPFTYQRNGKGERWIDVPFAYIPWWDKRTRRASEARRSNDDSPISMTYGVLPPFAEFEQDIRRPNPDYSDGRAYWPEGAIFPMELVESNEQELAYAFGGLEEFETERQRSGQNSNAHGFRGNEQQIYSFLEYLTNQWNNEGDEPAGDLASGIMTTLGYEWI